MTPSIFIAGLQSISSWVISIVALVAVFVSVIVFLVLVELVFERGAFAQAYTVKSNSGDEYPASVSHADEN
ncbi:MAG TPA: hypothetical protein VKV15_14120 [Bryobacteraceae bacterium]|nr:hypothetical protein [Bryobacteraceae bacterium]